MNRDGRTFLGMADHDQHDGLFIGRPSANLVEEIHRIGRVGQGREFGGMECCQQEAAGNTDAFMHIIVLAHFTWIEPALALPEDGDDQRCGIEIGLVFVCAQGRERFKPFIAGLARIKLALFLFGGDADAMLVFRRCD